MAPYVVVLSVVMALVWLSVNSHLLIPASQRTVRSQNSVKPWNVFDVLVILTLALFAAFRGGAGTDTENYYYFFRDLDPHWQWFPQIQESPFEPGFTLLGLSLKTISPETAWFFFVMAAVSVGAVYATLRRRSKSLQLAVFLYLSLGFYFAQFNTSRQSLAVSLCFYAGTLKRRKVIGILIFLVAVLIHYSAIVFVGICVATTWFDRSSKQTLTISLILAVIVVIATSIPRVQQLIGGVSDNYSEYLAETSSRAGLGYIAIMLLYLAAVVVLILGRQLHLEPWPTSAVMVGLLFLSLGVTSVVLGRLADYFLIFVLLVFPNAIVRFTNRIMFVAAAVLVGAAYMYLSLNSYGDLIPYG